VFSLTRFVPERWIGGADAPNAPNRGECPGASPPWEEGAERDSVDASGPQWPKPETKWTEWPDWGRKSHEVGAKGRVQAPPPYLLPTYSSRISLNSSTKPSPFRVLKCSPST